MFNDIFFWLVELLHSVSAIYAAKSKGMFCCFKISVALLIVT